MKKKLIWTAAVLAVAALAAGWYVQARKHTAFVVENGSARPMGKDEARRINKKLSLPGDTRPALTPPASAAVQKNLDTINQINRINEMNKKQNGN